jgi:Icc-related predicted phosphoesterase
MKILALTDIHGAYAVAEEIIRNEPADVVVIGGDLTTVGAVKDVETALAMFSQSAARLLCVSGNMDLPQHDRLYEARGIGLNERGISLGDVGFYGVSGAPVSRLHTPYEITEEEIARRIPKGYEMVRDRSRKVFVPHAPPYGTNVDIIHVGIHVGSMAVREWIEETQPDVVICGHIHEARGRDHIDKSEIVNCGSAADGYYAIITLAETVQVENRHHPPKPTHRTHR